MEKAILVVVGFILAFIPKWFDRKRKIRAHWNALSAEISRIEFKSNMFLKDNIQSPLYRLPFKSYETSFSMLLTEGAVKKDEVNALEAFYDLVQDINRGLDQTASAVSTKSDGRVIEEYRRNQIKVNELIKGADDKEALIVKASEIVSKKCKLSLIQY